MNSVTEEPRPAPDPYGVATERVLRWILLSYCLLVLCASLYPFAFAPVATDDSDLLRWRRPARRDLLVNLVAYLPVGWALFHLLRRRLGGARAVLTATAGAALLSLCIELLQRWVSVRVPSLADWSLNTVSGALGALLAASQPRASSPYATRLRRLQVSPALALLLVLWFAAHAAPFVPRMRWRLIEATLQQALAQPFDLSRLATTFAAVLVLSAVLRTLVRRDTFWPLFAATMAASLLARLLFIGQQLTLDQVAAVLLALPLIAWLRQRGHRAAQTPLFAWIVVAIVVAGTAPWQFTTQANPVDWRPFGALLVGRDSVESVSLLTHVFLWIGAVWVGAGSPLGLRRAALLLVATSLAIELAQCFLVGRSADPTPLLLLLYGTLLVQSARAIDGPAGAA